MLPGAFGSSATPARSESKQRMDSITQSLHHRASGFREIQLWEVNMKSYMDVES